MQKALIYGLILVGSSSISVSAQRTPVAQQPDGVILSSKLRSPLPAYETLDDFGRSYFPRTVYEKARTQCVGMNTSCLDVADLYLIAKAGFVVIASDYRYQGATLKRDQWGGVEVDDVLNLVPALKSLGFVDSQRLYMLGLSRGGTMTYLAIKRGAPIRAAAVIGGVTDVKAWVDSRPDMNLVDGNPFIDGFRNIWPDYAHRTDEEYHARSAVDWADQINVPVLILHSRTDQMVPVTQALELAEALQQEGKAYALHIYEHDSHPLPQHREDRNRLIIGWFSRTGNN